MTMIEAEVMVKGASPIILLQQQKEKKKDVKPSPREAVIEAVVNMKMNGMIMIPQMKKCTACGKIQMRSQLQNWLNNLVI